MSGRSDIIKKLDIIFIGCVLILGLILLFGFKLYENYHKTGNVFAQVTYKDELVLMIDLDSLEYKLYDSEYKELVNVGLAEEGIFYVPGTTTTDMQKLYLVDDFARENLIVGVKLLVSDGKIEVAYQESPKNICELQRATNSSLEPLVCLPNELVVTVLTNLTSDEFIPDSVLE